MTAYRQSIRVIYPQDGGRLALRTDANWDADVEAFSRNGCTTEFQVETDRPYFYFKPVLLRDGTTMWSRGENCLAVPTSGSPLEVHPFFREDLAAKCHTPLLGVASSSCVVLHVTIQRNLASSVCCARAGLKPAPTGARRGRATVSARRVNALPTTSRYRAAHG